MDGTNLNVYKQRAIDINAFNSSFFCSSFVPLKLVDEDENVYWQNPRPSSTRFCRPIRILYEKETYTLCKSEEAYLKKQIDELRYVQYENFSISFRLLLTMIDGKVRLNF